MNKTDREYNCWIYQLFLCLSVSTEDVNSPSPNTKIQNDVKWITGFVREPDWIWFKCRFCISAEGGLCKCIFEQSFMFNRPKKSRFTCMRNYKSELIDILYQALYEWVVPCCMLIAHNPSVILELFRPFLRKKPNQNFFRMMHPA